MKSSHYILAMFACTALMGCGSSASMRDTLGLNREAPDEYRVVSRPPLSMPPEFNLRPPGEATNYVSGKAAQVKARDEVLGTNTSVSADATGAAPVIPTTVTNLASTAVTPVSSGDLPTNSESQLLSDAGASKADSQVRQKLLDDKLNGAAAQDPNYLFGGKTQSDSVVDASKEAERIKDDKAAGKPVTAGDTPVIVPKDTGILGNIF